MGRKDGRFRTRKGAAHRRAPRSLVRTARLLRAAARAPLCVSITGAQGSGRSTLLRAVARLAGARGWRTLLLEGAQLGPEASLPALPGSGAILVGIDDCDHAPNLDGWARACVRAHLGTDGCLLLAGTHAPDPDRVAAWGLPLRTIRTRALGAATAAALLTRRGVHSPGARGVLIRLAAGSPHLLGLGAGAWRRARGPAAAPPPDVLAAALEQFAHPGSRRLAWRIDPRAGMTDQLLALAALLPVFDWSWIGALWSGPLPRAAWEALVALPCVESLGSGRHRVRPQAAAGFAAALRLQRPWQERFWRCQGVRAARARLRHGLATPGDTWRQITQLAREAPWFPALHPPEEATWRVRQWTGTPGEAAWRLQIGDQGGRLLAAGTLAVRGERSDAQRVWSIRLTGPSARAQCVVLRELLARMDTPSRVTLVAAAPAVVALASSLGWRAHPSAPGEPLCSSGDGDGLATGAWPPLAPPQAPPAPSSAQAVRSALAVLADPQRLEATELGAWCARQGGPAPAAAWLVDALASADLQVGAVDGGALLRGYYLDDTGPHERLAEVFNLARTSYFRAHRRALARLGLAMAAADWACALAAAAGADDWARYTPGGPGTQGCDTQSAAVPGKGRCRDFVGVGGPDPAGDRLGGRTLS